MKFIRLKWHTRESSLWTINFNQWKEVVFIAKAMANKNSLELINVSLLDRKLEVFFVGTELVVERFVLDFKQHLYRYLKRVNNKQTYHALSNVYKIEETSEDDPRLLNAIREELIVEKLNSYLYVNQIDFLADANSSETFL